MKFLRTFLNFKDLHLRVFILVLLSILTVPVSMGRALNDITVRLYNQREIIAGNYTSFCHDSKGFLWIGTDTGLLCFDGNHLDLYRNDESDPTSISDNKIISLFTDSRGLTWVGTVNGLNCYNRESDSFSRVLLPGMMLNGFISDITELPDGRIIFVVGGIGLYTVDPDFDPRADKETSARRLKMGVPDENGINRLFDTKNHGLVVTTRFGSIYFMSHQCKLVKKNSISGNPSVLALENDDNLIFSTQFEIYRLNLATGKSSRLNTGGAGNIKVTGIVNAGPVTYLSTAGNGIWEIEVGSDLIMPTKRLNSSTIDLSVQKIGCLYADRVGNIWIGCNHKGVAIAPSSNTPFINKSLSSILKEVGGEVTCMKVVGNEIAIGTNVGNVFLLNTEGDIRKVNVAQGNPVTSLALWKDGKFLVGVAREGIWSIDMKTLALNRVVTPKDKYPGVVLSVGKKGEIVAAFGEIGVLRFDPATKDEKWFYPSNGSNVLSCSYYSGIHTSEDGKIWIGGYSGIACYDPVSDSLMPIDQKPFLKGVVYDFSDCTDGVMIATDHGLIKFSMENGVENKITIADGLPDNDVRTLQLDSKGGMWIGTMKGLAYYNNKEARVRTFCGNHGIAATSYLFSDIMPDPENFVIGSYENLVLFNPDSLRSSDFGGDVKITGLYLNGKRLVAGSNLESPGHFDKDYAFPESLHLSYDDNSLIVRISTLDFRDSSGLRYEWQFLGDGDNWHSTSPGESLIYLPPLHSGKHVLRIRGWENDVASDISELKINVDSPWYLSNIAYASYVIFFIMIGALVYKLFKNKRDEELYEAKIRYFMDISHELRSPVTLMLSPVDTLLKQAHSPETTSQLLTVRRNAQRVLSLVDQLLDLRKIEKGKMRLVFTSTDIREFVEELVDMFRPMAEEKNIKISFRSTAKELWAEADRNNLDKILVNLISNAIKYTPKGGEIIIALGFDSDSFGGKLYTITVTDSGIGLDNKVMNHLFERFYRNREYHHGNASGFGIGLDLCLRLVELHKGDITAKNRDDGVRGSVFTVRLPFNPTMPGNHIQGDEPKHVALPVYVPPVLDSKKTSKTSHRFRILVIDDDEELREYVKNHLGGAYKVVAVPNAEEALKVVGDYLPDLIVSDIRMDGIDGIELLRRVKANMSTQHIPVILLSSSNDIEERTKGWKLGADGYLAKPFSVDELEGMVSGLLQTRNKLKGKFSGKQGVLDSIKAPDVKGVDEELMKKINNYINANLSESSMNVDSLSEHVGLSRSQLHRRMKDIFGISPSDYIRNVKLRKACEMLEQGDVDIAQVAYSLGFNAQSHFSTLFKRYTGVTPTDYRTNSKKENPDNPYLDNEE